MLGIVVSRADSASVHIGERLREVADWERHEDRSRPDATGGGTVYRTEGASLREFEALHLDLKRPAAAFEDPALVVVASRHSGETGPLLTAHHTGNVGPADHGGRPNDLARACPNAHARVLDALADHAPDGYEVGMECTHHGPSAVGAPSMFVEVGSSESAWADPAAARAVAQAILDLQGVDPDRPADEVAGDQQASEVTGDRSADEVTGDQQAGEVTGDQPAGKVTGDQQAGGVPESRDRRCRHLVGLGGGHYAPRFERVVRETDWAVGHVLADWGFEALRGATGAGEHAERLREVLDQAFEKSAAAYALVDRDRPAVERAVDDLGYRAVGETWVRETAGVDLDFVRTVEAAVGTVTDGLRFGERATGARPGADWTVESLPGALLDEAFGIDREKTRRVVAETALAFETGEGGTRPAGTVVLADPEDREHVVDGLLDVLDTRYNSIERRDGRVLAREEAFDPDLARTLGVPEGPAFGHLSNGQSVEVDGDTIPPEAVTREREREFSLS
jgi:D-aminoacyl-tRNA deacylase